MPVTCVKLYYFEAGVSVGKFPPIQTSQIYYLLFLITRFPGQLTELWFDFVFRISIYHFQCSLLYGGTKICTELQSTGYMA